MRLKAQWVNVKEIKKIENQIQNKYKLEDKIKFLKARHEYQSLQEIKEGGEQKTP
jgi:hypothetical protein